MQKSALKSFSSASHTRTGFGLNSFWIKILACVFMLVDHIGYLLLPQYLELRIIGRLAFPLFAFMIANGCRYTHDMRLYFGRILIFGIIIHIPYALYVHSAALNIFFTLALGIAAIAAYNKYPLPKSTLGLLALLLLAIIAELIKTDYGAYGVLLIFLAHAFYNDFKRMALSWIALNLVYFFLSLVIPSFWSYIQIFSVFALLIIYLYNGKEGTKAKYLFYLFYPLHLLVLYLLSLWIYR